MEWLIDKFISNSTKTAIIFNNKKYSYKELVDKIEYYNKQFKNIINPGNRVALITDYSFEALSLFLFSIYQKCICIPITIKNNEEINRRIEIAKPEIILRQNFDNIQIEKVNNIENVELYDILKERNHAGLVIFSSGTTGQPKGMVHDIDNIIQNYKKDYTKEINTLVFMSLEHIGGIDTLLRQLSICGTMTLIEKKDPDEVCRLIQEHKVDVLPTTPSFINLIYISKLYQKYDLSSIKILGYGAEPMPPHLLKIAKTIFPNAKIQQKFGISETSAIKIISKSDQSPFFKFDDPNIEYKIVNNELWIKSKNQILGYLNNNDKTLNTFEDGWFKTGDIVEEDEDGYIKVIGRNTDIINVGGKKVYPIEVEKILMLHEYVSDCLVYGEKNIILGQIVVADIVLKENINPEIASEHIRKFCKENLEDFKIPVKFNFVSSIELSVNFKRKRSKLND